MNTAHFLTQLKQLSDPVRAVAAKQYHKSNREHWGVTSPQCAELVRAHAKELNSDQLLALAKELWVSDLFDLMMSAAKIVCLKKIKPSDELWQLLRSFLTKVDGWALEDSLAHAAWKCILAKESLLDELEEWTKHPNFWMRRAALVYTLPYAKSRNPERMLKWAGGYAKDPEWFIQKAIGWWLRVLGERNPEAVCAFLSQHWDSLKGVARKEATRKIMHHLVHTNFF